MPSPSVTFKHWGPHAASGRYRGIIPQTELQRLGVEQGADWLVIGKHGWDWDHMTRGFSRVCFDVCDDHMSTDGEHGDHYREAIRRADLVTCNSQQMARVIEAMCGRRATVIPDPYEQPEQAPRIGSRVLWFGHQSNLQDLVPWVDRFPYLEIVTGGDTIRTGITKWSPQSMDEAFDRAGIVIIPTGKSMAKSANRAIESIRRGLFVVAGFLPAYGDLGIYVGDIGDGVEWALSHRDEALERIKRSQDYIRGEYSPQRIGALWKRTLFG